MTTYSLALHGGAGTIAHADATGQQPYHHALRAALTAGEAVLARDGSALEAVVAAVSVLEDEPLFNAGRGAVLNASGEHELDAGVMEGTGRRAAGVMALRRVRHPVALAQALLLDGRCVLMTGECAEQLAESLGLERVTPDWFTTPHRHAQWQAAQARQGAARQAMHLDHDAPARSAGSALSSASGEASEPDGDSGRFGTVGAVARDRHGHLAAATSTGGMTNKPPGRVGDSPIPGAGVYADDRTCAVSGTGTGEHFLRAQLAHEIHARMRYQGLPLAQAAERALAESLMPLGGEGGLVAVSHDGTIVLPYTTRGMYRAWVREGEAARSAVFEDEV